MDAISKSRASHGVLFAALLAILSALACATAITLANLPPDARDRIQSRRYDAPDSLIYSAVLSTLIDKGYPIQVSDRGSGLIQTEPSTGPCLGYERLSSEGYRATSDILAGAHFNCRSRVTANIKQGGARLNVLWERCTVQGSVLVPSQSAYEAFSPDTATAGRAYDTLFAAIQARLNQ
jgi:hypothetical protein